MKNEIQQIRLEELSKLKHSYYRMPLTGTLRGVGLIIHFSGSYSEKGHDGDDAAYMTAIAAAGLEAWQPNALIFDFRELQYTWGDRIQGLLEIGYGRKNILEGILLGTEKELKNINIKTVIIVSDLCRAGLDSLVRDEMRQEPADWIFASSEAAFAAIGE